MASFADVQYYMLIRWGGVQKGQKYADVIKGWSLGCIGYVHRLHFEFCTHNIILLEVKVNICLSTGQLRSNVQNAIRNRFQRRKNK